MWTTQRITADAAEKMQIGAGLLLNNFDVTNPVSPAEADIICDTTGDYSITCVPETSDLFEDVNNAFVGSMEGKRIDSWTCSLSIESLTFSDEVLKLALGAAETASDGGVNPRRQYKLADFVQLYWIGDMLDEDKLLVVAMDHAVSTGGLSLTTTNKGKGRIALEITPHSSLTDQQKIPMAFYILTKVGGDDETLYVYTEVTPVGTENPKTEGWYVLVGDNYRMTTDTEVDTNVTYYEREEA